MRWWLGAQLVAWGVVAACTALVRTAEQLYVLRLLLGAAEAGAAPCCYALLSAFYPYERCGRRSVVECAMPRPHITAHIK